MDESLVLVTGRDVDIDGVLLGWSEMLASAIKFGYSPEKADVDVWCWGPFKVFKLESSFNSQVLNFVWLKFKSQVFSFYTSSKLLEEW